MASAVIGALRVNLGIDSAQFSKGLKQAESGLSRFGSIAKKGLIAAAAAGTAAAGAVAIAVRSTINSADAMSKAAQKFGVPIEELSRLKYAADLSGVSMEGLGTGLRRLSQNMNDAAKGTGEGLEAFEQLGIKVTDAEGKLRPTTEILAEMADRFNAMPDGAEKTALAMDLMGRSGADMIPLLNGGSEALNKLLVEAEQFGQVFDQEMGASAEAFNDNMTRISGSFGAIAAGITKDVLPSLERFSIWLVENGPAVQSFATTVIGGLINGFIFVAEKVAAAIQTFQTLQKIFEALPVVVTIVKDQIVADVKQLAADILATLAALPAQMLEIGKQIIQGLWDGLKSKFAEVKASVAGFANDLVGGVKSTLGIQSPSTIMHAIGANLMEGLKNGISSGVGEVGSLVQSIGQTIQSAFSKMVDGLISGTLNIREAISGLLADLAKLFINRAFQMLFSGGGAGGAGGLFGGLFAGFFAGGGRIPSGQYGIVGEMGPELVKGPATVIPTEMVDSNDSDRGIETNVEVPVRVVNAIDGPGLLSQALGTRAGERVFLNFISQNARAVQGAIGGG